MLRHIARGLQSKEIAKVMSVSPHTVDYHARGAIEALSVSTRMQAALLLVAAEDGGDYQRLIAEPVIVADQAP